MKRKRNLPADGISRSMSIATVQFTMPGRGRITVQEKLDHVDAELRALIIRACDEFMKEYGKLTGADSIKLQRS
jgi:hypothetical protein